MEPGKEYVDTGDEIRDIGDAIAVRTGGKTSKAHDDAVRGSAAVKLQAHERGRQV